MLLKPRETVLFVTAVLGLAGVGVLAQQLAPRLIGRQADGSVLTPTNQTITPAGVQIEFDGRPNAMALSPDRRTAAILNGNAQAIVLVDLESNKVKQVFDKAGGAASYAGIVYSSDGKKVYASQPSRIVVAGVQADGTLALERFIAAPRSSVAFPGTGLTPTSYPGGLALSSDGKTLYVALSRNNTLGVYSLERDAWSAEIAVGNAPHDVLVRGNLAYVSNQGGQIAKVGDKTIRSSGTPIVTDKVGSSSTGTVSVVDLSSGRITQTVKVGRQPTALLLEGERLFVTNTNADTVSVVDTRTNKVSRTISVKPFAGAMLGSSPNGLASLGDGRIAVSLGRNNAAAIYRVPQNSSEATSFEGLIPAGTYPTAVATDPQAKRLYVLNGRGVGALGAERKGGPDPATNKTARSVYAVVASLSSVPFPSSIELTTYTAQVLKNNAWNTTPSGKRAMSSSATPVPIPAKLGDPSTFKHVFYIIKENRTYDQVLGDQPNGNGKADLTQFGREVVPNLRALVERFGLLDNTYVSGTNSADGHQWSTQAFVDDYVEKSYGGFTRSYPFNGGDALVYPATGFLWDNALKNGKTARVYGEYVSGLRVFGENANGQRTDGREVGPWLDSNFLGGGVTDAGVWSDFYSDALVMGGKKAGPMHVLRLEAHSDIPVLDGLINRDYPPYHQVINDQYRAEVWLKEFNQYVKNGNLPDLNVMALTSDHTNGTAPTYPTPRAMVADNDYALGRVVEAISSSPYWKDSLIVVVEDDSQNGVDHVSGHRTPANVISAYSKPGTYSQYLTQIDLIAGMERVLNLPPMNQMDMAVDPSSLSSLFTETPNLTPFKALEPKIALDELNPKPVANSGSGTLADLKNAWALASSRLDFSGPDRADLALLNRSVWYATKGYDRAYPGDKAVLLPGDVHTYLKSEGRDLAFLDTDDAMLGAPSRKVALSVADKSVRKVVDNLSQMTGQGDPFIGSAHR